MALLDPLLPHKLLLILGSSSLVCAVLIMTQKWHGRLSLDHDLKGAQKLHAAPVPRVGGLGLFCGLLLAVALGHLTQGPSYTTMLTLLVCAIPVFMAGLIEDLTKNVSVRARLLTSFISAGLATWLLNARVTDIDIPFLDDLTSYTAISALLTIFVVGGVTHAVNIIDGLNGLAAGAVSIMLAGLGSLAWVHGDYVIMKMCFSGIAAMLGFLLLNYPFGRIFLGDGGAYLAGFWLAECAVLLLVRNPAISTWAVILVCCYPIWETLFSMYRRHVVHQVATGQPDMAHLHQLIYKRLKARVGSKCMSAWVKHGLSSASIWSMTAACQIVALAADSHTAILLLGIAVFVTVYVWIYKALALPTGARGHTPPSTV